MKDDFRRYIKKIIMRALLFPLRILPVNQKKVLLINELARNYSGNPKYVAECLISSFPNELEIIYAVDSPEKYNSPNMKFIKFNSINYFICLMTSKVFLTNSGGFSYVPLRKSQYVINTWHGGGAYKSMGLRMYNDTEIFRKDLRLSAKDLNMMLSTCKKYTEVASEDMLIPKSVFCEIGMPRNDILLNENHALRQEVREKLGLRDNERLVLFAPTYRKVSDNYFKESIAISYGIDPQMVCDALEKRFAGKWRFAMRLHPRIVNESASVPVDVMNFTHYPDMQELLLAADVLINDFSSSMWDFMLTKKPCFIFATDLQHYVDTTKVYTPVSEWPFPKAANNDELEKAIIEFDEEKYATDCKRHYESLGGCETGTACEQVCKRIAEVCGIEVNE